MKKKRLTMLVAVGTVALLIIALGATAAFAGGGVFTGAPNTTVATVPSTDTRATSDITATSDAAATTAPSTDTTATAGTTATADTTSTTGTRVTTDTTDVHPDNWGATISGLRHAGDHTPAALLMGKKVPGWHKHQPTTTTTGGTP